MKNVINIIILISAYINQSAAQGSVAVRQVNEVSTSVCCSGSAGLKNAYKIEAFLENDFKTPLQRCGSNCFKHDEMLKKPLQTELRLLNFYRISIINSI